MIERLRVRIPAGAAGELSSPGLTFSVLTLIRCPFHPVLPQRFVNDPGHSTKSAGGRLQLNTHSPLTQRSRSGLTMLSRLVRESIRENELTRNSSGNTRPQSSQLAEPPWTDPGEKKFDKCVRDDFHFQNNGQLGNESPNLPPRIPAPRKKLPPQGLEGPSG